DEDLLVTEAFHRGREVLEVGPDRRVPLVAHRARADVDTVAVAIAAAAAGPFRDALGPRVVLGKVPVFSADASGIALLPGGRRLGREAVEALDDVGEEGRLALLAVGDDIDAGLGLPAHDVRDRAANELREGLAVVRLAAVLRAKESDEVVGSREAPDVRGQDPVRAPLHRDLLLRSTPGPAPTPRGLQHARPSVVRDAAVGVDGLSGDEAAVVGDQEQAGGRDLVDGALPPERDPGGVRRAPLIPLGVGA